MSSPVEVIVQPTPNPNALKFTVSQTVSDSAKTYTSVEQATDNPLAQAILRLPHVQQVFFLNDFVTVTRANEGSWDEIVPPVEAAIREHLG